jgi:chromosome segregation ATPase
MTHHYQTEPEARIRNAMRQLLAGPVPDGLKCDVKSLCTLAGVPRATLYRTYPHLKAEFDRQRQAAQEAGQQPDPRLAQIERLKAEVATLRERLSRKNTELDALKEFQAMALSRLAAQHDEITTLRRQLDATPAASIRTLPHR